MNSKQNPFSVYDFLGYFTPGALFVYGVLSIYAHMVPTVKMTNILSFEQAEIYIPFILVSYTLGHFLSYCSSLFIEKYSIWTAGYPSRYLLDHDKDDYFCKDKMSRFAVALLLLPVSLPDFILHKVIGFRRKYARPLDKLLIDILNVKIFTFIENETGFDFEKMFSEGKDKKLYPYKGGDFFNHIYHYTVENAPNHLPKMQNYVALYGFLRAVTFLFVIAFWAILLSHPYDLKEAIFYLPILGTITFSFIFYLAFVKFYRRFSLESLMALAAVYEVKKKVDPEVYRQQSSTVGK